jgi:hypothetical protein
VKRVLALFCVLVLLAVACSDDDGDTSVGTDETSSEDDATDDEASGTEEPDEQDAAGADDEAPDAEEPVEDVALFASFQGVTAEQIDFGVAAIDAEALLAFGFDLGVAPVEQMYEAWSAAQNERGGVLGRQLVPHTELFLPIGATESEAVCVKFAEDIGLFATIGQFLQDNPAARIDYIHGSKAVTELGSKPDGAGFYLPAISKFELFRTIILDGALPRKTFSMGEADEKRYYLECRQIMR